MVARNNFDKGMSTLVNSQFNYDGIVHPSIPVEEARQIFDYNVIKEQSCRPDGTPIPKQFHLVREDHNALLDTAVGVGEEFSVACQPVEAFDFIVKEIMPQLPDLRIETVATMYNGATCFLNLTYKDGFSLPNDESEHFTNILYCNPLSRGRISVVSHAVRVICMNTLARALKDGTGFRISHTTNARHLVEVALETIKNEIIAMEEMKEKMTFLAQKEITPAQVNHILDRILPIKEDAHQKGITRTKNARNEVMEQFEKDDSFTKPTFWSFFSANSYLSEHPLHKQNRIDGAQVAFENIIGARSNHKNAIFDAVYDVAMAA